MSIMNNFDLRCRIFLCTLTLGISLLFASCATVGNSRLSGSYGNKCAWCKAFTGTNYTVEDLYDWWMESHKYQVWRGEPGSGTFLGKVDSEAGARELIGKDNPPGEIVYGGMHFCSLRCLNAYKASIGVKEERYRIIPYE